MCIYISYDGVLAHECLLSLSTGCWCCQERPEGNIQTPQNGLKVLKVLKKYPSLHFVVVTADRKYRRDDVHLLSRPSPSGSNRHSDWLTPPLWPPRWWIKNWFPRPVSSSPQQARGWRRQHGGRRRLRRQAFLCIQLTRRRGEDCLHVSSYAPKVRGSNCSNEGDKWGEDEGRAPHFKTSRPRKGRALWSGAGGPREGVRVWREEG